jgi:O-6-methylguanine DNA methyltransferase
MKDFEKAVYQLVSKIPRGKVLTYGRVAQLAGLRSPRLVGKILHNNPDPAAIPCHRVVNSKGESALNFAFGGRIAQISKLRQEKVFFKNNKVDLKKSIYNPGQSATL